MTRDSIPRSLRQWVGHVASGVVNLRLRGALTPAQRVDLAKFVNEHPGWLESVDEELFVPTEFGFSMYCNRRSGIGQTLMATGVWEGLLSRTLLACLEPGDIAVDIGANIGYDTLLMSHAVGEAGLVFAFEPEPVNLALLLKNVEAARHKNVIVQTLALSDSGSVARISAADAYYTGRPNLRATAGSTRPVLAGRLDQQLQIAEVGRIAFVKMDIEGFEWKALEGAGRLIDRVDCVSCEMNPKFLGQCGSSPREIFGYLRQHGFQSFCAEAESDGRWVASDHDFLRPNSRRQYFDALFCRAVPERLKPLVS